MARATDAVVAFVEGPSLGGSGGRHLRVPQLLRLLNRGKAQLPDMGLAPKALLLHALDRSSQDHVPSTFTPVRAWLKVRAWGNA